MTGKQTRPARSWSDKMMKSERIMAQAQEQEFSLSPLKTFFAKVAIVTGAFLIAAYSVTSMTASVVTTQFDRLALTGGPAFWGTLESRIYALADAPDLAPEKKKKIIDAIHKLSVKYKPYVDAFAGDGETAKPGQVQARP